MNKPVHNREEAILLAAEREFLARGFEGARTTSIAEAAGVTHAMLHYYFRTKEQLFERILDAKLQLMSQTVLSAFGEPGLPLADRLRNGIGRHFDFIAANPDLPRFIVNEVFARPERYDMMRRRIAPLAGSLMREMQQELDAAAACGQAEPMDVGMLLLDIISLNVFPFLAYPLIEPVLGDLTADRALFFARRRDEHVEVILRRLNIH